MKAIFKLFIARVQVLPSYLAILLVANGGVKPRWKRGSSTNKELRMTKMMKTMNSNNGPFSYCRVGQYVA
jgi:hypothetical protein